MKKGQITEGRVRRAEFPNKGIVVTEEGAEAVVKNCNMKGASARHKTGRCGQKVNCPRGAREAALGRRPLR